MLRPLLLCQPLHCRNHEKYLFLFLLLGTNFHARGCHGRCGNTEAVIAALGGQFSPRTWAIIKVVWDQWIKAIRQACCTTLSNCFCWQQWEWSSHGGNGNARTGDLKWGSISRRRPAKTRTIILSDSEATFRLYLETQPHLSGKELPSYEITGRKKCWELF